MQGQIGIVAGARTGRSPDSTQMADEAREHGGMRFNFVIAFYRR